MVLKCSEVARSTHQTGRREGGDRGTSLIRNCPPLEPYSRGVDLWRGHEFVRDSEARVRGGADGVWRSAI